MQRICILSIAILAALALIAGCQRSEDVSNGPEQVAESGSLDSGGVSQTQVTEPVAEGPSQPTEGAVSDPDEAPVSKEAAKPTEPASDSKSAKPTQPKPDETLEAANLSEPPPEPPKLAEIDQTEYGPDPAMVFASNAFPPTLSDAEWHQGGWGDNACLRCHETGVAKAPRVFHKNMPDVLLKAKCRSCHVRIPGDGVDAVVINQEQDRFFDEHAFPPMLPNSKAHVDTWRTEDCMRCHEEGLKNAPITKHASQHMPRLLLKVKCRTCHVQVRAIESALTVESLLTHQ